MCQAPKRAREITLHIHVYIYIYIYIHTLYIYIYIYVHMHYIYIYIYICILPVPVRCYVSCFRCLIRNARCNTMSHLTADAVFCARLARETPDVTPCRTSPPMPFFVPVSRETPDVTPCHTSPPQCVQGILGRTSSADGFFLSATRIAGSLARSGASCSGKTNRKGPSEMRHRTPFPRRVLDIILPSRWSNIGAVRPFTRASDGRTDGRTDAWTEADDISSGTPQYYSTRPP